MKSEPFKKLDYRVVHTASVATMLVEQHWTTDSRWILTEFLMSDEGAQRPNVTPRFILGLNDRIVLTTVGIRGWKEEMLPRIIEIAGAA
ncbi:MAG: hypothetical protein AB7F22_14140 [Reyranella sp.]|uniref:hypothetical protein n=1 Tax=Reyranella sp. TaxID=1929291 RepID=UPI003D099F6C